MEVNFTLAALGTLIAACAGVALVKPKETYQWLDRKRYRYNVTLALYMLTPTERFIFSMLFSLCAYYHKNLQPHPYFHV
jgi:hypothetical protein